MANNWRCPDWDWYCGEAALFSFGQYAKTGKVTIPGPFLLVLFSMFYEDMITWCNENPQFSAFHNGYPSWLSRFKYWRYDNRLLLRGRDGRIQGTVFYNDLSEILSPLATSLLEKHRDKFPDVTATSIFNKANNLRIDMRNYS